MLTVRTMKSNKANESPGSASALRSASCRVIPEDKQRLFLNS